MLTNIISKYFQPVMSEIILGSTIPRQMKHFWTIFLFYKSPQPLAKTPNGPPVTAPCYCTHSRSSYLGIFQIISITLCIDFWVFVVLYLLFLIQVSAENMDLRIILLLQNHCRGTYNRQWSALLWGDAVGSYYTCVQYTQLFTCSWLCLLASLY